MEEIRKVCTKCGVEKPLDQFYPDARYRHGREAQCKVCKSAGRTETNRKKSADRSRQWTQDNPERVAEHWRRSAARHPERRRAGSAVHYAVRSGKLPRATTLRCVYCGDPAQQYHHHLGYALEHRLDVVPVCAKCHKLFEFINPPERPILFPFDARQVMERAQRDAAQRAFEHLTHKQKRRRANWAVGNAVERGKLPRVRTLQCTYCPNQAQGYHHHKGYAPEHRLDVIPVCHPCHVALDAIS